MDFGYNGYLTQWNCDQVNHPVMTYPENNYQLMSGRPSAYSETETKKHNDNGYGNMANLFNGVLENGRWQAPVAGIPKCKESNASTPTTALIDYTLPQTFNTLPHQQHFDYQAHFRFNKYSCPPQNYIPFNSRLEGEPQINEQLLSSSDNYSSLDNTPSTTNSLSSPITDDILNWDTSQAMITTSAPAYATYQVDDSRIFPIYGLRIGACMQLPVELQNYQLCNTSMALMTKPNYPRQKITRKSKYGQNIRQLNKEKLVHRCSVCNKGFTNKSNIAAHMRIHTGEKPFVCKIKECLKKFSQKAHLQKHMKIHQPLMLTKYY